MKTSNQFSKTKMCAYFLKGECKKGGKECLFAHSPEEIRPMPNLANTKLCPSSLRDLPCANRDLCQYAHDPSELKSTDFEETHKTVMCFFYKRGKCLNGPKCRFAHGNGDLRLPAGEAHSKHQKCFASGRSKQLPANCSALKTSSCSTQLLSQPPSSPTYTFEPTLQDTCVANCSSSSSITRPSSSSSYLHSGSPPPIYEISSLSSQGSFSPCPLASPSERGRASVPLVSLPFLNSLSRSAPSTASMEPTEALCCSGLSLCATEKERQRKEEEMMMKEVPCSDSGVPKITVTSPEGYVMRPLLTSPPPPTETRRVEIIHRWADVLSENEEDITRRWREMGDDYDVHSSFSPNSDFSCPSSSPPSSPSSSPPCSPTTSFSASPRPSTSPLLESPMAGYQTDDDHHFAQCYSKYVEHIQKAPSKDKHLSNNLPCNKLYKKNTSTKRGEGQVPSFPLFSPLPLSTLASSLTQESAALGCGFGESEKAAHNGQTSSAAFFHIPPPPPPAPVSLLPAAEQTQKGQGTLRKEDTVPLICVDQLAASLLPLLLPQPNDAFTENYFSLRHPQNNVLPLTNDSSSIENAYEALKLLLRTVQQQQMLLSQLLGVSPFLSPHCPSSAPNATQQTAMAATAFGSSSPSPLPPPPAPLSLSSFLRPLLQETVHQPGRI